MPPNPGHPSLAPALIITAAPGESRAVAAAFGQTSPDNDLSPIRLTDTHYLVQSGVGKVNAALAAALIGAAKLDASSVISLGVAGALPRPSLPKLPLRSVVVATASIYADEGSLNPDRFVGIDAAGFPPGGRNSPAFPGLTVPTSQSLTIPLLAAAHATSELGEIFTGPIATVSTCSGTDALAADIAARTGAIAEAMEGAAIGHAFKRIKGPDAHFAEIRVISNPTGDRHLQTWDLPGAFAKLTVLARCIATAIR